MPGRHQPDWDDRRYRERNWSGTAAHSSYLQILAEQGLVGLALCGYIVWASLSVLRRLRKVARVQIGLPADLRRDLECYGGALAGAIVGYLAAGAFLSMAYAPYPYYFGGLAVALDAATRRELKARREARRAQGRPRPLRISPRPV